MFNKMSTKNYLCCLGVFIEGMLSVSIANIFRGYYCSVAVIEMILATILIYNYFDKKENVKENIINIILVGTITFFGIIFFVVNDIFNVPVYVKNDLGFWGICVIISQILSICAIIYISARFIINFNKSRIEIIDNKAIGEEEKIYKKEKSVNEKTQKKDEEKEIKSIVENSVKPKAPFMEEVE